ncbi:glycosyltransferase WbuB [Spirochaetia bacterium]|nr:glycosyltransferase WbuB [Spirochaetia bacterium]
MPSCIIPYPYYYPDDAVSSRHFTDFAEGLYLHGWNVKVLTGNRYHGKSGKIKFKHEFHNGVEIIRSWSLPFSNSKNVGRLINSFWISLIWWFKLVLVKTDVVIFGTNPPFGYYIIPLLTFIRPKLRVVLWGFDLYPEAIVADRLKIPKIVELFLFWWAGISYRCCTLLIDIGSCMHERFILYHPKVYHETIVPWALKEPIVIEDSDSKMRHELFGDAKLGLLYSGTIGKAHQFEEFIFLARELRKRGASIAFCFAGRGNSYQELCDMVTQDDTNITFADFIDEKLLPLRLTAADIHLISLRHGWDGVSVPSKFFGSLAAGRPLLYCGTLKSCIAKWICDENLGFILTMDNINAIADNLETLAHNTDHLQIMQKHAFSFYQEHFSKNKQLEKWNQCLRNCVVSKK